MGFFRETTVKEGVSETQESKTEQQKDQQKDQQKEPELIWGQSQDGKLCILNGDVLVKSSSVGDYQSGTEAGISQYMDLMLRALVQKLNL